MFTHPRLPIFPNVIRMQEVSRLAKSHKLSVVVAQTWKNLFLVNEWKYLCARYCRRIVYKCRHNSVTGFLSGLVRFADGIPDVVKSIIPRVWTCFILNSFVHTTRRLFCCCTCYSIPSTPLTTPFNVNGTVCAVRWLSKMSVMLSFKSYTKQIE